MARVRGGKRDGHGFLIADFADEDDVRVLPEGGRSAVVKPEVSELTSRWEMMLFLSLYRNSIGSSMVTMFDEVCSLIWSIMEARVVDLPEPVVPVTRIRPRLRRERSRMTSGRPSCSKAGTMPTMARMARAGVPALLERVHAETADVADADGEVEFVLFVETGLLVPVHQVQDELFHLLGSDPLVLETVQLAVDAESRLAADAQMQIRRVAEHHLLEEGLNVHISRHLASGTVIDRA